MIAGAPGAESVFRWTEMVKNVRRHRAGPIDASIRTGPVFLRGPEPGDVLEVRILDVKLRGCRNPIFAGLAFGSNVAAWSWGFQNDDLQRSR